jgi:Zn-dependent peptidase ImmA (M78 family)
LEEQLSNYVPSRLPRIRLADDPEEIAYEFRQRLGVTIAEQGSWTSLNQALRQWRAVVEAQHVFVFQFGMPVDEVRGFSLLEEECPAIVLNQSDAISARIFTLFHEYAHLLVARPGLCLPQEDRLTDARHVETFCNSWAAAFLVPRDDLERRFPDDVRDDAIGKLARRYRVSRYVVAGRLRTLGGMSQEEYHRITRRWRALEERSPTTRTARRGGLGRAARCLSQRGRLFVSVVVEAAQREYIPANDATSYLGIRVRDLRRVAAKVK